MSKKYTVKINGILPKTCEVLIADGNPLIQGLLVLEIWVKLMKDK